MKAIIKSNMLIYSKHDSLQEAMENAAWLSKKYSGISFEVCELKCEYKNGEFKSSSEPITAASIVPTLDQSKNN